MNNHVKKNRAVYLLGMVGSMLFITTSLVGGWLIKDYNLLNQLISETYAIDTEYGLILRWLGFIPSGVLLVFFCFLSADYFKSSAWTKVGFYGIGIFYGLATVIVSIFPCDSGCNKEWMDPSISQMIHNLTGFLTYLTVPFLIMLIGFSTRRPTNNGFSNLSITIGVFSFVMVALLLVNINTEFIGLYQRMIESSFLLWVMACASILKKSVDDSKS